MTTTKVSAVAVILLCALSTGGQQAPPPPHTLQMSPPHLAVQQSECATSSKYIPSCYQKIVQSIPIAANKIDYLALVADDLQNKADYRARVIDDLNAQVDLLHAQVDSLQAQVAASQNQAVTTGTYQISAVTFYLGPNDPWTAVFRINTKTGLVCQVVGPNYRKGELMGGNTPPISGN